MYKLLYKNNTTINLEMGIYENGNIFGIRIYNFNDNDYANILMEKTYREIMGDEEKKNVYLFYTELNSKNEIHFEYYTECSSTYGKGIYFKWIPLSLAQFLEKFNV